MIYTIVYPTMFYLLFYSKNFNRTKSSAKYWTSYIIVAIVFIFIIGFGTFSRIYLGMHSFDQIIFSVVLGVLMFCHIILVYRDIYNALMTRYMVKRCTKRECIVG